MQGFVSKYLKIGKNRMDLTYRK